MKQLAMMFFIILVKLSFNARASDVASAPIGFCQEAKDSETRLKNIDCRLSLCGLGVQGAVGCQTCHKWQGEWKIWRWTLKKPSKKKSYEINQKAHIAQMKEVISNIEISLREKVEQIRKIMAKMKAEEDNIGEKDSFLSYFLENSQDDLTILDQLVPILEEKLRLQQIISEEIAQDKSCLVCIDSLPTVLFFPCRHLVTCETCSPRIDKCPQCDAIVMKGEDNRVFIAELKDEQKNCSYCEGEVKNRADMIGPKCHHLEICQACCREMGKECPVMNCRVEDNALLQVYYP